MSVVPVCTAGAAALLPHIAAGAHAPRAAGGVPGRRAVHAGLPAPVPGGGLHRPPPAQHRAHTGTAQALDLTRGLYHTVRPLTGHIFGLMYLRCVCCACRIPLRLEGRAVGDCLGRALCRVEAGISQGYLELRQPAACAALHIIFGCIALAIPPAIDLRLAPWRRWQMGSCVIFWGRRSSSA
jgi:hypothetical protein